MKLGTFLARHQLNRLGLWRVDYDVTMTSKSSHFEFRAAILNPEHAVIRLAMTTSKNM